MIRTVSTLTCVVVLATAAVVQRSKRYVESNDIGNDHEEWKDVPTWSGPIKMDGLAYGPYNDPIVPEQNGVDEPEDEARDTELYRLYKDIQADANLNPTDAILQVTNLGPPSEGVHIAAPATDSELLRLFQQVVKEGDNSTSPENQEFVKLLIDIQKEADNNEHPKNVATSSGVPPRDGKDNLMGVIRRLSDVIRTKEQQEKFELALQKTDKDTDDTSFWDKMYRAVADPSDYHDQF